MTTLFLLLATALSSPTSHRTFFVPQNFVSVDGVQIHYRKKGKGPNLLLIHGFNGHTFSWRYQWDKLSRHFTVYAVDLKGFGFSDKPLRGKYGTTAQVEVLVGLMDVLKIKKAHVAGHSIGAHLAMEMALAHPKRIDKLILVSAALSYHVGPPAGTGSIYRIPVVGKDLARGLFVGIAGNSLGRWYLRRMVRQSLNNTVGDPKVVDKIMVEGYARPINPAQIRALFAMVGTHYKLSRSPSKIPHDTLIIWGDQDTTTRLDIGKKLDREIKRSKFIVYKNVGHLPAEEVPEKVNQALSQFLLAVKKTN